ncbi:SAM-dependent methyltransferase [Sphingomonas sp. ASY06-1R]|uniref:SAM-dependent methyltransferase n=1 Tax=Sphingomonas sp. ASY06-1R TaxID=3445771 RepID=UPI003FA2CC1C
MPVDEKMLGEITAYIRHWGGHLDLYFGGKFDLAGKRLLVIGSGWGTEVLWALRNGAAHVTGIDPRDNERAFVEQALAEEGLTARAGDFTLHQGTAPTVADLGAFDLILSNNVFEHIEGLSANLAALARFLPDQGGRIFLFADPLFYASAGHHLPIGPWEHLTMSQDAIRDRVSSRQWREYRNGLNGMTITVFLEAVREAGLILMDLGIRPDPNLERFAATRKTFPPGLKPMDLCLSGISCTLAFPHNI